MMPEVPPKNVGFWPTPQPLVVSGGGKNSEGSGGIWGGGQKFILAGRLWYHVELGSKMLLPIVLVTLSSIL